MHKWNNNTCQYCGVKRKGQWDEKLRFYVYQYQKEAGGSWTPYKYQCSSPQQQINFNF